MHENRNGTMEYFMAVAKEFVTEQINGIHDGDGNGFDRMNIVKHLGQGKLHGEPGRRTDGNLRSGPIRPKRKLILIPREKLANRIKIAAKENVESKPKRKLNFGAKRMDFSIQGNNARKDELENGTMADSDEERTTN